MKHMNRVELKRFTKKYFPCYKEDIRKVSYIVYKDRAEYLVNDHCLFVEKFSIYGIIRLLD